MNENIKIQYLDIPINFDQWTEGRWSIPIEDIWKEKIDPNYDVVCFPIQKYNYKRKFKITKICKCCNREFTPNSNKQTICGFCFDIKVCEKCKRTYIMQHGGNGKFCSHDCSRSFASSKMQEWYKKHPEKRSENCKRNHEKNSGPKYCEKCKKITPHLMGVGCVECHNKTESKKESSRIYMTALWSNEEFRENSYSKKYCENVERIHSIGFLPV